MPDKQTIGPQKGPRSSAAIRAEIRQLQLELLRLEAPDYLARILKSSSNQKRDQAKENAR